MERASAQLLCGNLFDLSFFEVKWLVTFFLSFAKMSLIVSSMGFVNKP